MKEEDFPRLVLEDLKRMLDDEINTSRLEQADRSVEELRLTPGGELVVRFTMRGQERVAPYDLDWYGIKRNEEGVSIVATFILCDLLF